MKGSGGLLLLLIALALVAVYYTQSGAPDTGGATDTARDVAGDLAEKAPGPGQIVDGAGKGAEKGADGVASITNEASKYPLMLGALAIAGIIGYLWRRNKTVVIVAVAVMATVIVMSVS